MSVSISVILNFYSVVSFFRLRSALTMKPNGPAVIISKRYSPPVMGAGVLMGIGHDRKERRVRLGFCHHGTNLLSYTCVAVKC
jgi:hypothetical protein